jgi:SAM-dependent methyltransferase
LLTACNAIYLTQGLEALRTVPDQSIDFGWSHAVLEHVRRDELDATFREFNRVLRPGGRMSHRIDLEDHLAGSINSLRFPRRLWESRLIRNSGFYTNRLRAPEIIASADRAGFHVTSSADRWAAPPLPRRRLSPEFRRMADDTLSIRALDLVGTPKTRHPQ